MKTIVQPQFNHRSAARSAPHLLPTLGAFNPSLPEDGALILADVLRNQFNGLVVMIQSIPAGPPGPQGIQGIQGPPFATAIIDSVQTLEPAEPAWVTSFFDGTDVHFSFGIPRGYEGVQGQQGIQGPPFAQAVVDGVTTLPPGYDATVTVGFDGTNVHFTFGIPRGDQGEQGGQGIQGEQGIQGPPFAQAVVDSVTTLPPSYDATVTASFDGTNVHFTFGIPRGDQGEQGEQGGQGIQGEQGIQGIQGEQGAPGEVTTAQLNAAISGTSSNTNAVATLGLIVSDPPTQAEMQSLANKVDELILALRR